MKVSISPDQSLQIGPPTNTVLVTCISVNGKPNIITLGMYMPISRNPPLLAIGVSPKRYSHNLIAETAQFVINVPTKNLIRQVIFCGTVSGREHEKFSETQLTPVQATKVKPPFIKECVSNLECKVAASYVCGDHTLFIGEVVASHIDEDMLKDDILDVQKAQPISHKGGVYYTPKMIQEH